jgi:hypothetical protein
MVEAECSPAVRPRRDPDRDLYELDFDIRHRDPSTMTVMAVEEVSDTRMEELTPIVEAIDPDALNAVFDSWPGGSGRRDVHVTFPYEGYEVTVDGDGTILLDRV